jgi:hypothetical protein
MKNIGTLQVTTPTEREVVMTRIFDAPRRLVFDALTKPELFKRWFGPRGWSLAVSEIDLKVAWEMQVPKENRRTLGCATRFKVHSPRAANAGRWMFSLTRKMPHALNGA